MLVWFAAHAARLPVRTYTTADGLARNTVYCIVPDSHGFLWLCTIEGLSRFDGYEFRNYGIDDGLRSPVVNAFIETRDGKLVAGTNRGVAVQNSRGRFDVFDPGPTPLDRNVNALLIDRAGTLWCGTSGHLYRIGWDGAVPKFEAVVSDTPIQDLAQDRDGNLWAAAFTQGLVEVTAAGEIRRYAEPEGVPYFVNDGKHHIWTYSVAVDGDGAVWLGTHSGLCRLRKQPAAGGNIVERVYTTRDGLGFDRISSLYVTKAGRLWIGTTEGGAAEWTGEANHPFRVFRAAEGLVDRGVESFGEDEAGNLWMGTGDEGVKRIAHDGFITYQKSDGLADNLGNGFTEGKNGELIAVTNVLGALNLNRFDGERFTKIHPALPPKLRWMGWGMGPIALQDREGDWWLATGEGLCRYDRRYGVEGIAKYPPKAIYTSKDGLSGSEIFRLFEDGRGDIWVATNGKSSVNRWDRATGTFVRLPGLPENDRVYTAFAEDRDGTIWMGAADGLFRWRAGLLQLVDPDNVLSLMIDHAGHLWRGGRSGLFRSGQPAAEHPEWQKVFSEAVGCLTEDRWGRIYACTGHGVACLDPASGRLRRFTIADGLSAGNLQSAFTDRRGDVWFGASRGISRLTPRADAPHPPAPVYITSVRSSGREATAAGRLSLSPYENSVEVNFVGIEMGTGRALAYEFQLEGAQREWQALGRERSIRLAALAPGRYRLLVRAINNEGAVTNPPASLDLFVASPLWRRWWSLTLLATALATALYAIHRSRMRHALELERVRTRIATDLHDDVGASLSQVAIMSEVASRQAAADREALAEIAGTSRELLQSMSEIVWAVDPSHDRLADLTQRMRWFAGETLSACGIALQFSAPDRQRDLRLEVDTRRQVFLIFKECVNNVARHARARNVWIELSVDRNQLVLRVEDDGCGFDMGTNGVGHGLRYMASRARMLNAALELESRPGAGTRLHLRVPLGRQEERRARIATA